MLEQALVVTRGRNSPHYIKEAVRDGRYLQVYDSALEPTLALEKGFLNPQLFKTALVEAPKREGLRWDLSYFLNKIAGQIPTIVSVTQEVAHSITPDGRPGQGWEALVRNLEERGDVRIIVAPENARVDDFLRAWSQTQLKAKGSTTLVHPEPLTEPVQFGTTAWLSRLLVPFS